MLVLAAEPAKGDGAMVEPLRRAVLRTLVLVFWVGMAGSGVPGTQETPVDEGHYRRGSESEPHGWMVQYRFVGDPEEAVYQEFRETGPEGREVPYPGKMVRVRIVQVALGDPPVDEDGLYRYRSLFAETEIWPLPLFPGWPWRDLRYEFTGLRRKDPETGQVLMKVEACPLLGRWFASILLPAGLIAADAALLVGLVRLLIRRARRTAANKLDRQEPQQHSGDTLL